MNPSLLTQVYKFIIRFFSPGYILLIFSTVPDTECTQNELITIFASSAGGIIVILIMVIVVEGIVLLVVVRRRRKDNLQNTRKR